METPRLVDAPELLAGVRGLIFDKDGTLTDLDYRWFAFAESLMREAMEHLGLDIADLKAVLAAIDVADGRLIPDGLFAVGNSEEIRRAAEVELVARGARAEHVHDALQHGLSTAVAGPLHPLGAMSASLHRMAKSGLRIGVATADDRQNAEREMVELEIDTVVSALRCGSDSGPVKPSGEVLSGICAEWNLSIDQVVYVGDSLGDRATAENAGMRFIAVRHDAEPERWESDAWIASVDEIAKIIDRY